MPLKLPCLGRCGTLVDESSKIDRVKSERTRSLFFTALTNAATTSYSFERRVKCLNTIDKVRELSEPLADELGYELVDVEYVKEGKNWFLRLYIDKEAGVDLDDCALFSEKVGETLDAIEPDPIPHAYYLEVSSPGAERPLKTEEDFEKAVGKYIYVALNGEIGGFDAYEGHLKSYDGDELVMEVMIKTRRKELVLSKGQIAKARYAIEF